MADTGTYAALKRAGHSPAKAGEIILDAKRGCDHARRWIAAVAGDLDAATLWKNGAR